MSFDSSRLLDTACIGQGHVKDSALRVLRAKYRTPVLEQLRVRPGHGGGWAMGGVGGLVVVPLDVFGGGGPGLCSMQS
jgi:hypothetical protein